MGRRATGTVEPLKTRIRLKFTWLGKRQSETLELAPTPANIKAAERLLSRLQSAVEVGVYRRGDFFGADPTPEPDTFAAVADRWFATKTGEKSTLLPYRRCKDRWKADLAGKLITEVRHSDIAAVVKRRAEASISGKTINNDLIVIRGIFELAEADDLVTKNPTAKIEQQKHQAPLPDPFSRDEMEAILAYMAQHYAEPVVNYYETMFSTGLRPSEAIAAPWANLDERSRTLRIDRASVLWEAKGTKTHTVRDVDLTDRALAAIGRQKPFTFMRGVDTPIFSNPNTGRAWGDEQRQRRAYFQPALRALGIRQRDAYNTRHTYATLALMGGVNPAYIARQLGHSTTAMLFRVYSKWIDGADKGAEAAKLNGLQSSSYCPGDRAQR